MTANNDNIPVFKKSPRTQTPDYPFAKRYTKIQEVSSSLGLIEFTSFDTQEKENVTLYYYEKSVTKLTKDKIEEIFEQLTSLQHTNIKTIVDYEITDSIYWTEKISSGISFIDGSYKTLSSTITLSLINQLIDTFNYIHQYQVIGKLSWEDVRIKNDNEISISFKSIILDQLGIANITIKPPEQKASQSFQSKFADIYIAAIIIEKILSMSEYANKLAVDQVVSKAKHDEPSKRFHELSTFKSELNKQFKHNAFHLWLSGNRAISIIAVLALALIYVMFTEVIVQTVINSLPKSQDEQLAIQQESQINIEQLETKLSSYTKQIQYLNVESGKLANSHKPIDQKRKQSIDKILMELDDILSQKEALLITAKIHAIDTLHKEKYFEKSIEQTIAYSKKINIAYDLAYYGVEVDQGYQKLKELEIQYPSIAIHQHVLNEISEISKQIKSHEIASLYSKRIYPLLEYYQQEANLISSKKIDYLLNSIEKNMVIIPSGTYLMGIKKSGFIDTKPVHQVEINSFKVSKYEMTVGIFNQYLMLTNKKAIKANPANPLTNVNWFEAIDFVNWLSNQSGKSYRLLTESEWEYLAKANLSSTYHWGNSIKAEKAQCIVCLKNKPTSFRQVGSFSANHFGIFDINGNVWEWTEDCYKRNYQGASASGKAYNLKECPRRVIRGGAWNSKKVEMHPSYRTAAKPDFKSSTIGFRIAINAE